MEAHAVQPFAEEEAMHLRSVPTINLASLCQDEINSAAMFFPPLKAEEPVNVVIDRSIFNESAGSRRQTYDRYHFAHSKHGVSRTCALADDKPDVAIGSYSSDDTDLILKLCRCLNIDECLLPAPLQRTTVVLPLYVKQECLADGGTGSIKLRNLKRIARMQWRTALNDPGSGKSRKRKADTSSNSSKHDNNNKKRDKKKKRKEKKKLLTAEDRKHLRLVFRDGPVLTLPLDAFGFPAGWKACVRIKHRGQRLLTKILKYISPESKECFSFEEAIMCGGAVVQSQGICSVQVNASSHVKLESKALVEDWQRNGETFQCSCGKSYAYKHTLRRHASKMGHALLDIKPQAKERTQIPSKEREDTQYLSKGCYCATCGRSFLSIFTLNKHATALNHFTQVSLVSAEVAFQAKLEASLLNGVRQMKLRKEVDAHRLLNMRKYLLGKTLLTGSRRHQCHVCRKRYALKQQLVRHLDTHKHSRKGKKARKRPGKSKKFEISGSESTTSKVLRKCGRRATKGSGRDSSRHLVGKRKRQEKKERLNKPSKICASIKSQGGSEDARNCVCGECGKEFSEHFGHACLRASKRTHFKVSQGPKKAGQGIYSNLPCGYRELLSERTGTYFSGLPAKLLFSDVAEITP